VSAVRVYWTQGTQPTPAFKPIEFDRFRSQDGLTRLAVLPGQGFGNRSTIQVLIPSNSREFKTEPDKLIVALYFFLPSKERIAATGTFDFYAKAGRGGGTTDKFKVRGN